MATATLRHLRQDRHGEENTSLCPTDIYRSFYSGTRPPNPKEKVKMTSNIFQIGFGGEPIVSQDGKSLEGVGETRLSTWTIYTDKLFTGQRDVGLGEHSKFVST